MCEESVEAIVHDHDYSKVLSVYQISENTRPAETIFTSFVSNTNGSSDSPVLLDEDEDVDVVTVSNEFSEQDSLVPAYDVMKARSLMLECQHNVNFARVSQPQDDWDEKQSRSNWSQQQSRLYTRVAKALQAYRLARLSYKGHVHEVGMRRLYVDKAAKRIRHAFAITYWDKELIQWLHNQLMENVSHSTLAAYLDVLQTLRSKIPELIDGILEETYEKIGPTSSEALQLLLKRPWDPCAATCHRLSRLNEDPVILVVPGISMESCPAAVRRQKFWNVQFGQLGKVIPLLIPANNVTRMPISAYRKRLHYALNKKLNELDEEGRSVVLIGWDVGALVACQVAARRAMSSPNNQNISAIVCLGFPLLSADGTRRGDVDDVLLEVRSRIMFVIGERASKLSQDDVEEIRERLEGQGNSLLVVGGADDMLRVNHVTKKRHAMTQTMVDRVVLEKVEDFLHQVFGYTQPEASVSAGSPADLVQALDVQAQCSKTIARKRKSVSSTGELKLRISTAGLFPYATTSYRSDSFSSHSSGQHKSINLSI